MNSSDVDVTMEMEIFLGIAEQRQPALSLSVTHAVCEANAVLRREGMLAFAKKTIICFVLCCNDRVNLLLLCKADF